MSSKIIVSNNIEELSEHFAHMLIHCTDSAVDKFSIALSGGSTPKAIFDYLAMNYQTKIDWNKIRFFWGDERCVPPDHPDSNYLMTFEHLFDKIKIPEQNIFRVDGDNKPESEAQRYSEVIIKNVPLVSNIPSFDLIMLGLGEDGHTASIFPDSIDLINDKRICAVSHHPELCQKRITITGTIINNAKKIVFLVTGEKKSEMIDIVLNKKEGFEKLPSAHINPTNGELIWLLDKGAAKLIN